MEHLRMKRLLGRFALDEHARHLGRRHAIGEPRGNERAGSFACSYALFKDRAPESLHCT